MSQSEALTNTLVTSEPQIKVHRYGHAGKSYYSNPIDTSTHHVSLPRTQLNIELQPQCP